MGAYRALRVGTGTPFRETVTTMITPGLQTSLQFFWNHLLEVI